MSQEMMSVEQLAVFLQRDARELQKLASRGSLPAHKVSGEYRFHPAEIHHWLETQMHGYTEEELSNLEQGASGRGPNMQPLLTPMLSVATIAVPLQAATKASVLNQLVKVAEQSWQVYDPAAILQAIKLREEIGPTALPSGVAIPHPRRPLAKALGESLIAFGRTSSPVPFGRSGRRPDGSLLPRLLPRRPHAPAGPGSPVAAPLAAGFPRRTPGCR